MTPDHVLEKYRKIKNLYESATVEGEKQAAFNQMVRLEKKHPTIKEETSIAEEVEQARANPHSSPEGRHWSDVYKEQQKKNSWREYMDQFSQAATNAFGWASEFASAAFGVREARVLAEQHTGVKTKTNGTGSVTCNVRITPTVVTHMASVMNDERLQAYCTTVGERVASELYHHLANELGWEFEEDSTE